MDLSTGLVFVIVFLLTYFIFVRPRNLPPGPVKLPFIGSILYFQKNLRRPLHEAFHEAARRYGSIISFQLGNRLAVVLDGYDMIHEALVKKADVFSDRPKTTSVFQQALKDIPGQGVVMHHYGDSWRMLRRFTLQALRDFGVGKTSIEEKIMVEVEAMGKFLDDAKGKPVSMNPLLQSAIGNVIYGIIFGRRYEYDDPDFERIRQLSTIAVSGRGFFSTGFMLPKFLARLINKKDVDNFEERIRSVKSMKDYVFQQIDEHESTFDPDNVRDFVDIYIQTRRDTASDQEQLTRGSMFRVIIDLFVAGSETTSTTLDWAFLYMTEFPEVQRKCQNEIDEVVGQKTIEFADFTNLSYVAATIQEIQRVSAIVPLGVAHNATKDATLGGYAIPKDTMIIPNLYSASFDPKYWDEPNRFNPDRFIDGSGEFVKHPANIPFSEGPRVCLGEPLARMELFVVIANLLQRFKFKRENDTVKHTLKAKEFQVTNCPLPYKLRVSRRF